jgi:hypothetical protein
VRRLRVLALGVLTLLPLGLLVGYTALFASLFTSLLLHPPVRGEGLPPLFEAVFGLSCLFTALTFALAAFYVVHAMRNPRLSPSRSPLWLCLIFLGAPLSMPVYWYLYFWRGAAEGQDFASDSVRSQ